MQQSRFYILFYAAMLTIVCGGLLALAAEGLKEKQQANIELERKSNILATVLTLQEGDNIEELYNNRVRALVVDYQGNVRSDVKATDVVVVAEFKKAPTERLLPVYEFLSESDPNKVEYVVLPMYGNGLWNLVWGFIALQSDFNTVQGVKFEHAQETPGLGARITEQEIQDRYKGKTIYEASKVISISMQKGEGNDYSSDPHKVDGMSGATLTAKGVNNMLADYFACYDNYLKKNQNL